MKNYSIGLKIWSTNHNYLAEIHRLNKEGSFDYIELYTVPGSLNRISDWKIPDIKYILHAPHYEHGLNLSMSDAQLNNIALLDESLRFADELNVDMIVVHSGVNGTIEETARQLRQIKDPRFIIENKPRLGLQNQLCIGSTPEEIGWLLNETGRKFCFDIGHAIYSANAWHKDPMVMLDGFFKLKASLFHLTDGLIDNLKDVHLHYGKGNFPLIKILRKIPPGSMITNEAEKISKNSLSDFQDDVKILREIILNLN